VDTVLNDVWRMARDNQLAVRSVKSDKPVPAALYMELPLNMVMEGNFFGFYEFLSQLERMPRITRIHDLHLERIDQKRTPNDGDLPPGAMRAEFTLSIYYEPENKDEAAKLTSG
jgi:Tfp pilus assembly protein PilO